MKTKIIAIIVIALIIIAGIAYFATQNKTTETGTKTSTETTSTAEDYTNLQTSDDSFSSIDESLDLLE